VFRTLFAKPLAAAAFLTINGLILLGGERLRRRVAPRPAVQVPAGVGPGTTRRDTPTDADVDAAVLDTGIVAGIRTPDSAVIGLFQVLALLAGISRSGITMVAGLLRGLTHEEAVRFAFLLATPIILAAGVLKIPDLLGPLGNGIRAQVLAGSGAAFVAALISAGFLVRWFRTRTLTPFAVYCLVFGVACLAYFH
jgi:undecaprenyl-diphosphatase